MKAYSDFLCKKMRANFAFKLGRDEWTRWASLNDNLRV